MLKSQVKLWPWIIGCTLGVIVTFGLLKYQPWQKLERAGLQIDYNQGQGYASVFLDDRYLEKAPLAEKNIQAGDYLLKIVPDDQNLAEYSTPISLETGTLAVLIYLPGETAARSAAIIYELKRQSELNDQGSIIVESYPEGAQLLLADQGVQFTPTQVTNLPPGDYQFTLSLDGYQEQQRNVQVLAGYETRLSVQLAKNSQDKPPLEPESAELLTEPSDEIQRESQTSQQEVWIKKTGFFVNDEEVLRVRTASSSGASELGFAKSETSYPYLEVEGVASNSAWLPIWFEDQAGWVSASFAELKNDQVASSSGQTATTSAQIEAQP